MNDELIKMVNDCADGKVSADAVLSAIEKYFPAHPNEAEILLAAKNHQQGNYEWQKEKRLSFSLGATWAISQPPTNIE